MSTTEISNTVETLGAVPVGFQFTVRGDVFLKTSESSVYEYKGPLSHPWTYSDCGFTPETPIERTQPCCDAHSIPQWMIARGKR